MDKPLVTILSIAASDPTSGAGVQADLKAAAHCGVYAMTALTAVTSQNSKGICEVFAVPPQTLRKQLECIFDEVTPDAIKIGMIGSIENGKEIASFIKEKAGCVPAIIDPVLSASAGGDICISQHKIIDFYINNLLHLATVVTPNLKEGEQFLGRTIDNLIDDAADLLNLFESKGVVLKGGHGNGCLLTDLLTWKDREGKTRHEESVGKRVDTFNLHGTGCTYASLLASFIAMGENLPTAFQHACQTVRMIISRSDSYSLGRSDYGPLNTLDFITSNNLLKTNKL